jgi:hypothetical protein
MKTKTDNPAHVGAHVFERAGLGRAPFRFESISRIGGAGGSCQYCSTHILWACHVVGADGRRFFVGTDCIAKCGDAGLIRAYKNSPAVRQIARDKRDAKDHAVIAAWDALMADQANVAKLSLVMVPGRPWVPGEQVTLYDSLKRLWGMCGASGRARTLKSLQQRLNGEE